MPVYPGAQQSQFLASSLFCAADEPRVWQFVHFVHENNYCLAGRGMSRFLMEQSQFGGKPFVCNGDRRAALASAEKNLGAAAKSGCATNFPICALCAREKIQKWCRKVSDSSGNGRKLLILGGRWLRPLDTGLNTKDRCPFPSRTGGRRAGHGVFVGSWRKYGEMRPRAISDIFYQPI